MRNLIKLQVFNYFITTSLPEEDVLLGLGWLLHMGSSA